MNWTLDYVRQMEAQDFDLVCEVIRGLDSGRAHEAIRRGERGR
ncbi:MAG TPA: hypothetical protein VMY98_04045 [Anaerolineae bacterium]|nr:hypothetical protein [Anaerolineae bacterium]